MSAMTMPVLPVVIPHAETASVAAKSLSVAVAGEGGARMNHWPLEYVCAGLQSGDPQTVVPLTVYSGSFGGTASG